MDSERRRSHRTVALRLSGAQPGKGVWDFERAREPGKRACVVLDASVGGLRLLVEPVGGLDGGDYELRLQAPGATCRMRLVWTKTDGLPGLEAGFLFVGEGIALPDTPDWVRGTISRVE